MTLRLRALWAASSDDSNKPSFLQVRSSKSFVVMVVSFMAFTDVFLYGLVVPVIPRAFEERLHIPASEVQTLTSILLAAYGVALLFSSPILGYISDHTESRRFPLLFGLLLLTGATVMLCAGTSFHTFVIGRALQGASAAMVWTAGLALLADNVEKDELGQCLGYVTMAMNAGTLLGPLSGGIVYDKGGYFAVYDMGFALIGLDIVLRFVLIEKKTARKYTASIEDPNHDALLPQPALDEDEGLRSSYGTVNVTNAGSESLKTSSNQRSVWQRRLPAFIWLLSSRRLLVALLASMMWGLILTSFDAVLPLFVMRTFGWSSSGSGLIFIALVIPSVFGPVAGYLADKYGPRYLTAGGFLSAVPFFVLLRLVTHASLGQEVLLCALLAFIGLAITFMVTPVVAEIVHSVDEKEKERPGIFGKGATAQAYGLFNCAFATGSIVGPLFAGLIKHHAGWAAMGWGLGALSAATSVPVLFFMGGWIGDQKAGADDD